MVLKLNVNPIDFVGLFHLLIYVIFEHTNNQNLPFSVYMNIYSWGNYKSIVKYFDEISFLSFGNINDINKSLDNLFYLI